MHPLLKKSSGGYLSNRRQQVKLGNVPHLTGQDLTAGIPQGSIPGPVLFKHIY